MEDDKGKRNKHHITDLLSTLGAVSDSLSEQDSDVDEDSSSKLEVTLSKAEASVSELVHHRYCDVLLRDKPECTCAFLINLERNQERREQQKASQNKSPSSDSFQSAILAGHLNVSSQQSSEASYYSAECTFPPVKSQESNNCDSSVAVSSIATCASSSDVLNKDIDSTSLISTTTDDSKAVNLKPNLNQAQDLFKDVDHRDTNHNINSSSSPPMSQSQSVGINSSDCDEATTMYKDIHPFLKRLSNCLSDDQAGEGNDRKIMSRLSQSFAHDPEQFAKRLVTIIEESDLRLHDEESLTNLDRLIKKFKKSCKYVQDESIPFMLESFITSPDPGFNHNGKHKTDINKSGISAEKSATPLTSHMTPGQNTHKTTPNHVLRNAGRAQGSPLYISALIKTMGPTTPGTPTALRAPASPHTPTSPGTPGSTCSHNDSTFTFLEKKCGISTPGKWPSPDMSEKNKLKRILERQEQLLATNSPTISPTKRHGKKCTQTTSESREPDTVRAHASNVKLPSSPQQSETDDDDDFTKSIMHELEKKRQRCFETQKTIREIDAESSVTSVQTSDESASSGILEFLNLLTNCSDYHNFLQCENIQQALRQREDSGVDIRPPSCMSRKGKSQDKIVKSGEKSKYLGVNLKIKNSNVTLRMTSRSQSSRKKSPTVRTSLSARKVNSIHHRRHINSPALMSRRLSPSRSILSSISPIDLLSTSSSSSQSSLSSLQQSQKLSNSSSTRTPRATTPLSIFNPTPRRSQLYSRTPSSASSKKLSSAKSPNRFQLSHEYMASGNNKAKTRPRSPLVTPVKPSTVTKTRRPMGNLIPKVTVTDCTPSRANPGQQAVGSQQQQGLVTPRDENKPRAGKFFNTPGKTPVPKVRNKPAAYFPVELIRNRPSPLRPIKSQTCLGFYSLSTVKSPVAAYIHSTDSTLTQNIRSKNNEYLLTPRAKKTSTDTKESKGSLKFKLSPKCHGAQRVDSPADENDENIPENGYKIPEVRYQLPSKVEEVNAEPQTTPRGERAKRLMESEENRRIIRHEGRAKPRILGVEDPNLSIHVTKSAEKKIFVARSKQSKK